MTTRLELSYPSRYHAIWKRAEQIDPKVAADVAGGNLSALEHNCLCRRIVIRRVEVNDDVQEANDICRKKASSSATLASR